VESQATQAQASNAREYERQRRIHQHQDQAKEQLRKVQAASATRDGAHSRRGRGLAAMRKPSRRPNAQFRKPGSSAEKPGASS